MKSIYVLQENFSKAIIKTEENSDFKWNREAQLQRAKHITKGIRMEGKIMKPLLKDAKRGFPGGAVVKKPPANAGDAGSSPGLGRSHMPRSGWACEP